MFTSIIVRPFFDSSSPRRHQGTQRKEEGRKEGREERRKEETTGEGQG
jgi:hypothetical protein